MGAVGLSKEQVVALVVGKLMAEREMIGKAALAAHEAATNAESKAEDQYDTRGLEASYLAGAQAKRAEEIDEAIRFFRTAPPKELRLARVECAGRTQDYLIARAGGGMSVVSGGKTIQVITPDSPFGGELAASQVGDTIEMEARGTTREYDVISID
jgi:hypothetical protein